MKHFLPPHRTAARLLAAALSIAGLCAAPTAQANGPDAYLGELMLFGGNFCPLGWASANGDVMSIANNEVLYALIGTTYGGDGINTFNLPDLRSRAAVGPGGNAAGLTPQVLGQTGGVESVTLTTNQLPAHVHTLPASTQAATHAAPMPGRIPAAMQNGGTYAAAAGASVPIQATGVSGSSIPIAVRDPFLAMQWCIAIQGVFPSRN